MHETGRLRSAPLMVFEVDADLAVVGWNDRAARALQIPRDAAIGASLATLLPIRGGAGAWRDLLARDDDAPQVVELEHPRLGRRHLELWTQPAGDGAPATIWASEVSDRVALEQRRRLDSTVLAAVASTLDIGLWALNRRGDYVYQEGKGVVAAGMRPGELVGQNLFDHYGHEGMEPIHRALAGEAQHAPPTEAHGLVFESWYVPVDAPGCDAAMVGITLDVSEARRREDELRARLELIERQREVIRELSTPIIEVWDGVLALPLVGLVDGARAAEIMDGLLQAIVRTRSRAAILDLTGVQSVDVDTAGHLLGLVRAIRLLGAEGVLTGLSPDIARTIVGDGVDFTRVRVFARLRDALQHCAAQRP